MNWFRLIAELMPVVEEVIKSIADALAAGKSPIAIHGTIADHAAALPAKIRE